MSVFRRGAFTLAEVLITLGIIGVVAALTTPAIIQNSQNAKIGPQMAKIKTTLETAIQAICTDQEKYYLKDIINPEDITDLSLAGKIDAIAQNYMKARPSNATLPPVVDMTGAAYGNVVGSIYEMADKSAIVIPECKFGKEIVEEGGVEKEIDTTACEIFALMPGFENRNRLMLGRDVFPFMVTKEGYVKTPSEVDGTDATTVCTNATLEAGTDSGYYCIDRIANNGWKANW